MNSHSVFTSQVSLHAVLTFFKGTLRMFFAQERKLRKRIFAKIEMWRSSVWIAILFSPHRPHITAGLHAQKCTNSKSQGFTAHCAQKTILIPQEKPPTFFIPSSFDRPRSAKNDGGTRKTVVPESFPRNDLRTKIFAFLRFVIVSIVLSSFETWTSQNNQKTSFQARSPTLT